MTDLLAPAQVDVGLRWQRGAWSAAEEAVATSVVDAVLSSLHERHRSAPTRGRVAVATVEGDWHALGARMVAEVLRAEGFAVNFLGASVPAVRLPTLLTIDTDAVVLSCSMACHLPSARRSAEAVLDARYPVVLGGRAVSSARMARALGASAWAPTAAEAAVSVLCALEASAHPVRATQEETMLEASRAELVERVVDGLMMEWPDLARLDAVALNRVRISADRLIATVQASVTLADETVLAEYVAWLHEVDAAGQAEAPAAALLAAAEAAFNGYGPAEVAVRRVRGGNHRSSKDWRQLDAIGEGGMSAEDVLRERARIATQRMGGLSAPPSESDPPTGDDSAVRARADRLLQEVERLRRRQESTDAARIYSTARSDETLDAARAQAARMLNEAESEAARVRRDAEIDAEATIAAAAVSATALIEQAEQEGLEMLAEAASEVVQRLDEAAATAEEVIAKAKAEVEAAELDRQQREMEFSESLARQERAAADEAQRQTSAAAAMANEILAKARAEAAQVAAAAQRERSEVAQESADLVAEAVAQLDRARVSADELQSEVAARRANVEAELEDDIRRLVAEAQRQCDEIVAAAHDEATRIVAAAHAEVARPALDLREERETPYIGGRRKKRRWSNT